MNSLARFYKLFQATTIDISVHGPLVCTTLSTLPSLHLSDRGKATHVTLWLSQARHVARVENAEPAGAHYTTHVRSKQAGPVAEQMSKKVHIASTGDLKLRRALGPATACIWVSKNGLYSSKRT